MVENRDSVGAAGQAKAAQFDPATWRQVLDTLIDPHVMLKAVRDDDGAIVDFVYVEANQAACDYNGMPHDELVGKRLLELLPGQDSGILDAYRQVVETGEPLILDDYSYQQDLPTMRGEWRQYDIRVARVDDSLSYTWRDVTEQYRARQALASSEARFRLAMAVVPVGIAVLDLDWTFGEANPALCHLLLRDRQWLVSHSIEQVLLPGEMARLTRAAADLLAGRSAAVSLEQRFLNGVGDAVTLTHRLALARDADGNPNSFVSQVVDGPTGTLGADPSRQDVSLGAPRVLVSCHPDDQLLAKSVVALLERELVAVVGGLVPLHQLGERVRRDAPTVILLVLPAGPAALRAFHEAEHQLECEPELGLVALCVDRQPGVRDMALRMSRPTTVLTMSGRTDVTIVDQALAAVVQGLTAVDHSDNGWSIANGRAGEDLFAHLTEREREVLDLLSQGLGNAAIADELVVTTKAVENYVGSIFRKLDLTDEVGINRRVRAALMYLGAD